MTRTLILAALVVASPAAAERRAILQSWGKPNVSFAAYRQDAITCGREGYYLDISNTGQAKAFADASGKLDDINQSFFGAAGSAGGPMGGTPQDAAEQAGNLAADTGQVMNALQPDTKMKQLGTMMQSTTDRCLVQHGYQRFQLTPEQTRHLGHLKIGSPARHEYLFHLASDPAVLAAQSVPADGQTASSAPGAAPSH